VSRRLDLYALNLAPDHILPNNFLKILLKALEQKPDAVAGPAFRLDVKSGILNTFERFRKADLTLSIPHEVMIDRLLKYLPSENYVDSDAFTTFPLYLCWKVGDNAIVVHMNHFTPWLTRGGALKSAVNLSLDPTDGFFYKRYLKDNFRFILVDFMIFDIGTRPTLTGQTTEFSEEEIANWLRPITTEIHHQYFSNQLTYIKNPGVDFLQLKKVQDHAKILANKILKIINK
jgi:hypothetical protein